MGVQKYDFWLKAGLLNSLVLFLLASCQVKQEEAVAIKTTYKTNKASTVKKIKEIQGVPIDLKEIKKRGKLVALTGFSYTSYFIYKGSPLGYQYELLKLLAKELDVKLEIVVIKDISTVVDALNSGEGDIIAESIPITKGWDRNADFTIPCNSTRQVLVQKLPDGWEKMTAYEREKKLIRNPADLIGKKVYVRKNSAFYNRLLHLSDEIGGNIDIVEVSGETGTEELIKKVATGEIKYTVADEQMALFNKSWFPAIDVSTPISLSQRTAWVVRESSPQLRLAINSWIAKMKQTPEWYAIYNKYFKDRKTVEGMVNCSRIATCGNKICPYDDLIIQEAKKIGWDWRLLTSIIYQESRFNPKARSWAGAVGLMQLMPKTAAYFGVTNPENPLESLKGGTSYLKWLDDYWKAKVPDKKERIKFVLASYNVGQGHVADAQRLAKEYGKNPLKWENNVAFCLLMKSKEKYANDPVVRFGYCRGEEPVQYVEEILNRYTHYKDLIKEDIYLASR